MAEIEANLSDSSSIATENTTKIELLSSQITNERKRYNKILFSLALILIVLILMYLNANSYIDIKGIYEWILKAGGLFGLGNLIFNAIKFFKKDK